MGIGACDNVYLMRLAALALAPKLALPLGDREQGLRFRVQSLGFGI